MRPLATYNPMKSSVDHLPLGKQQELSRAVELLHEEFEDALSEGSAEWKRRGRILKIILFGSYARGDWVDETTTLKGYRSDFDLLVVVNNKKLTDYAYWHKAKDRLMREKAIHTPTSLIAHSRRFVNTALRQGQYFFADIRREGIVLYELDEEPLAEPKPLTPQAAHAVALQNVQSRLPAAKRSLETFSFQLKRSRTDGEWAKDAAFALHQALEHAYAAILLAVTNYSPPSHNLSFLRGLAEDQDRRLVDIWPRDHKRYAAWFNTLNEAYVKARYSRHYAISEEALIWLGVRAEKLHELVEQICNERLAKLKHEAEL